ncbi:MAG: GtrA family protein [Halodesulfurarchaeum sp.]
MRGIERIVRAIQARLRVLASGARIGQFVSVGVAGASLETVIVFLLTGLGSAPPLLGKAVGAEASITLMFLLNDRFTFAEAGRGGLRATGRRFLKSHTVRLGGLIVAFATLYVLTSWTTIELVVVGSKIRPSLPTVDVWPTIANGIGIGAGMSINYVAESLITWRIHRD